MLPQGPELFFFLVVIVPLIGVPIWSLLDAANLSSDAFAAAGHNKTVWVLLPVSVFIIPPLGLIAAVIWLAAIAPRVKRAATMATAEPDVAHPQPPPPPG